MPPALPCRLARPEPQAIPFKGSAALGPGRTDAASAPPAGTATAAALSFSGSALDTAASMTATISALPLSLGAPYVAQFLEPTLAGTLNAAVGVKWMLGANLPALQKEKGSHYELKLAVDRLTLDKLALNQGKAVLASVQSIELLEAQLDPVAQSISLGKLSVTNPRVKVERDAGGRWMVEQWLKGGETSCGCGCAGCGTPTVTAASATCGHRPDHGQAGRQPVESGGE
jgi:hypothetical protein